MFWIELLKGWAGVMLSWGLPGWLICRAVLRKPLPPLVAPALSLAVGMVAWGWQGYLLGYLNLRFLTYGYLLAALILAWRWRKLLFTDLSTWRKEYLHKHLIMILLVVGGLVAQMPAIWPNAWRNQSQVEFLRINAYDSVMHLAYIQELQFHFPPYEPGAAGLKLVNYHYWSDLVTADLVRIWGGSINVWFFQILPPIISVVIGLLVYALVFAWTKKMSAGWWALALLYLGGDLIYLMRWLIHQDNGFGLAEIDNGATQFLNMPQVFAKVVFFAGLYALNEWLTEGQKKWAFLAAGLLGSIIGFKVYYGLFVAFGMCWIGLAYLSLAYWQLLKKNNPLESFVRLIRTQVIWIYVAVIMAALSAAMFWPVNKDAGGLFWSPLEWPRLLLGPTELDWVDWWLRRQVYQTFHSWKGLLYLNTVAVSICLLSIYGWRVLGLFPALKTWKRIPVWWAWFFVPSALLFTCLGLFTLQTSGLFNVFNFFVVEVSGLILTTAVMLDTWWSHRWWLKILVVVIMVSTVPRAIREIHFYSQSYLLHQTEQTVVAEELEALYYLKKHSPADAVVQAHPVNEWNRITPYVSYLSGRRSYLGGISMMESHNQPVAERRQNLAQLFTDSGSSDQLAAGFKDLGISYLYLKNKPHETLPFPIKEDHWNLVFSNSQAFVYQVK
jgi:hypothetical protein